MESYEKGLNYFPDKTFRLTNIDTRIIAPMFGYKDYMEYYKAAVISKRLNKITCPMLYLASMDDPLHNGKSSFPF